MSLCWEVFMIDVCKDFGFVSLNKQTYTNKAVTIIRCKTYWRFVSSNIVPTNENYWNFISILKSSNFIFVQQVA